MGSNVSRDSSKARVLSVISAKGGTGKTTLAISFGYLLARIECKVLLVDFDSATNGLTLFFLQKVTELRESDTTGILEGISGEKIGIANLTENLDLLPATYNLKDTSMVSPSVDEAELSSALKQFRATYDFIIIDSQPGAEPTARFAAKLSNTVLIITEYDPMSRVAIARLERLFSDVLLPEKTFYLANKVLPNVVNALNKEPAEQFFSIFRVMGAIPFDFKVMEAYSFRRVPVDVEKPTSFEVAVLRVLEHLFPDIEGRAHNFDVVRKQIERKPISQRIEEINNELSAKQDDLLRAEAKTKFYENRRAQITLIFNVVAYTALATLVAVLFFYSSALRLSTVDWVVLIISVPTVVGYFYWIRARLTRTPTIEFDSLKNQALQYEIQLLLQEKMKYETMMRLLDFPSSSE